MLGRYSKRNHSPIEFNARQSDGISGHVQMGKSAETDVQSMFVTPLLLLPHSALITEDHLMDYKHYLRRLILLTFLKILQIIKNTKGITCNFSAIKLTAQLSITDVFIKSLVLPPGFYGNRNSSQITFTEL